eukprot:Pgem_evm1s7989
MYSCLVWEPVVATNIFAEAKWEYEKNVNELRKKWLIEMRTQKLRGDYDKEQRSQAKMRE